jgi:hypothetical protein
LKTWVGPSRFSPIRICLGLRTWSQLLLLFANSWQSRILIEQTPLEHPSSCGP